jgi:hypothetical protein
LPNLSYAFNISPHRYELHLRAGDTAKVKFNVTNVYDYKISVEPCFYDKFVSEENRSMGMDCSKWIRYVRPEKFVLGPGKTKKITIKISIPEGAEDRLAAMISFPIQGVGQDFSPVQLMVSVPVYVTISP